MGPKPGRREDGDGGKERQLLLLRLDELCNQGGARRQCTAGPLRLRTGVSGKRDGYARALNSVGRLAMCVVIQP